MGIGTLSGAVLLVELLLTRIFSVTLYYHLSFLVVSLAMLGLGLGGLVAQLEAVRSRLDRGVVAALCLAFAVSAVLSTLLAFNVRIRLEIGTEWARLGLLYTACTIPFACAGTAIGLMLSTNPERANRLYFFDLAGAALACLLFIPLTDYLGAPTAMLVAAVLGAVAAMTLSENAPRMRRAATLVTWGLAVLAVANVLVDWYDVRVAKGERERPFLAVKWNAFSRVEVEGKDPDFWTPARGSVVGDSAELRADFRWPAVPLRYDASAATMISAFDGDPSHLGHLRYRITAAPHAVRRLDDVLIIGPGGGADVLTALLMRSSRIVGVEVNPLTVELMRTRFRAFSGGLYDGYPGVRIVVDEGRSYLRSSPSRFDLIQASLVDTWAASAAGAHALTENSLYTVEAFEDYLDHLKPDGMVAFARWYNEPPIETLRVVRLAAEALHRRGETRPGAHVFVTHSIATRSLPALATILVKRSEFDAGELERLNAWAREMAFPVACSPGQSAPSTDPFRRVLDEVSERRNADTPRGTSLVDDDRPFFFSQLALGEWLKGMLSSTPYGIVDLGLGGQSLLLAGVTSLVCLVLLLGAPLVRGGGGRSSGRLLRSRQRLLLWGLYFVGLGVGFIAVEVVLIQRLGLFLGYPTRALAVVMFTLLVTSGAGSLWAQRMARLGSVVRSLAALCALLVVANVALPRLCEGLLGAHVAYRVLAVVALVAPLGFLMGVPFASGVRLAARQGVDIPWAWAVNGTASVFGSCLTMAVATSYGFTASFSCGAAAYAVSALAIFGLARSRAAADAEGEGTARAAHEPRVERASAFDLRATGLPVGGVWALVALWLGLSVATTARASGASEFLPPIGLAKPRWLPVPDAQVEFGDGWFGWEQAPDGSSWRWMGAKGVLRLENRHREEKLSVAGWMPRAAGGEPPALGIFINGTFVGRFETELSFTHQLTVPADLQGTAERFEVTLEASTTIRPARDPRDLGFCLTEVRW